METTVRGYNMPNKIYDMKESWEAYPHEEHEKYVTPDRQTPRYYAVWNDGHTYNCAEVTEVQHKVFASLTKILGHDHMVNKGMQLVPVVKRFGKTSIKSMIKRGVFYVKNGRLWLTHKYVPHPDEYMNNGLRPGGGVKNGKE